MPPRQLSEETIDLIQKIIGKCEELNRIRNDVAHGLWHNGRRPRSITPLGVKAKGGNIKLRSVLENQPDYTPEDLYKVADELHLFASAVLEIVDNISEHP